MEERFLHKPVLLEEVLNFLRPAPGQIFIDATVGGGGHAEEILRRIGPEGRLIGIDRDKESLEIARERLKGFHGSFELINKNFKDLKEIDIIEKKEIDGILFDLGMSSIQIEDRERGFSIKNIGPLDMRMDRQEELTAKELVNTLKETELSFLIRDLGEDRFHRRIAKGIVTARKRKEIQTTAELAEIISSSIPYRRGYERIHPATRTFQALRIRVNDELKAIEEALKEAPYLLKRGGRLCVISFHSLEDRIVKNTLRELGAKGVFHVITKKPVGAGGEELSGNPRARSARLRAAERIT